MLELWHTYRPRRVGDSFMNAVMYLVIGATLGYLIGGLR